MFITLAGSITDLQHADTASEEFRSKAISFVLAGGVAAAILGPELANWSYDLFEPVFFAGGYLVICCITVISSFLLLGIDIPQVNKCITQKSRSTPLA